MRAVTGVSIGDIMKNGLAGGENSEMNKLRKNWTAALHTSESVRTTRRAYNGLVEPIRTYALKSELCFGMLGQSRGIVAHLVEVNQNIRWKDRVEVSDAGIDANDLPFASEEGVPRPC